MGAGYSAPSPAAGGRSDPAGPHRRGSVLTSMHVAVVDRTYLRVGMLYVRHHERALHERALLSHGPCPHVAVSRGHSEVVVAHQDGRGTGVR